MSPNLGDCPKPALDDHLRPAKSRPLDCKTAIQQRPGGQHDQRATVLTGALLSGKLRGQVLEPNYEPCAARARTHLFATVRLEHQSYLGSAHPREPTPALRVSATCRS